MTVQNLFQSWSLQLKQTGSSSCLIQLEESSLFLWFRGALLPETFWLILSLRRSFFFSVYIFFPLNEFFNITFRDFGKSSWMFFKLGKSIDVKIWQLIEKVTGNCIVFAPRSHFVNEISKEHATRLSGKLSCNWLIILVTMATPISSHVKDKNQYLYNENDYCSASDKFRLFRVPLPLEGGGGGGYFLVVG